MAPRAAIKAPAKLGIGCLIIFALPFVGFGLFAAYQAIKLLWAQDWKQGPLAAVFALVFCSVGFGLIAFGIYGSKRFAQQKGREAQHPDEPWQWREDWSRGEIKSAGKPAAIFVCVFALLWNVISFGVFFAIFNQPHRGPAIYLVALFPLAGVWLLVWAVRHLLRWRRFGESVFKLTTVPGIIGGPMAGVIRSTRPLYRAGEIRLRLACIERDTSGDSTSEHLQWEDEKVLSGDVLQVSGGIPVLFNIPFDCQATAVHSASRSTVWKLYARAVMPGSDYDAEFEVPVFKTAQSSPEAPALRDPAAAYEKPMERTPPPGITVRPAASGGTEFVFAAARYKSMALSLTLFTAIWTGAIVFMIKLKAPILFPIIFGLFDVLFLFVVIGVWTSSSRVIADAGGLRVTTRWGFVPSQSFLPAVDIQSVQTKFGMSSGQTSYYDLIATTKGGRKVKLASSIKGKKESEWFAHEMQNALARN